MVADLLGQTLESDGGRRVSGWPGLNRLEYLGLAEGLLSAEEPSRRPRRSLLLTSGRRGRG
eukprot:1182712-Prorocentrum_minimum.AAC.2